MRRFAALLAALMILAATSARVECEIVNTGAECSYFAPRVGGDIIAFVTRSDLKYYTISSGLVGTTGYYDWYPSADQNIIAFSDLTDPAEPAVYKVTYFNTMTGETRIGPPGDYASVDGSRIAFYTWEDTINNDVNNDGDLADPVIGYWDTSTGAVTHTDAIGEIDPESFDGDIIVIWTRESDINEDLNGDGQINGGAIRYYNLADGTTTNTGQQTVYDMSMSGDRIAMCHYEYRVGSDLNGDGDLYDYVMIYYNISTGTVTNTGAVGEYQSISGDIIAFSTYEFDAGEDLNGDGDTRDYVVRYYDISSGTVTNTGMEGYDLSVDGSIIASVSYEGDIGQSGEDLNGDGDTYDSVLRYYRIGQSAIDATVEMNPDALNKKSKGNYVTCYIELPGYDVSNIDATTVVLTLGAGSIPAETAPTEISDFDSDGVSDLMVKFDRAALQLIAPPGYVDVTITGSLFDGASFTGVDTINVMDKGVQHIDEIDPSSVVW